MGYDLIRVNAMRHDKPRFSHGCLRSVTNYQYIKTSGKINDFYSLINNWEVNIKTVLFSIINSNSEGCKEMAAEAGVEMGRIRLYHKHALIMQMSHSRHSQLLHQ